MRILPNLGQGRKFCVYASIYKRSNPPQKPSFSGNNTNKTCFSLPLMGMVECQLVNNLWVVRVRYLKVNRNKFGLKVIKKVAFQ